MELLLMKTPLFFFRSEIRENHCFITYFTTLPDIAELDDGKTNE